MELKKKVYGDETNLVVINETLDRVRETQEKWAKEGQERKVSFKELQE